MSQFLVLKISVADLKGTILMLHSGPGKLKIFGCNEKLPYLHFDHMNLNFKGHLQKCQIFSEDQIGAKLEIRKSIYSGAPAHLTSVDLDQSKRTCHFEEFSGLGKFQNIHIIWCTCSSCLSRSQPVKTYRPARII